MTIDFMSDAQRETYKRVARAMVEMFGDKVEAAEDQPLLSMRLGSAVVDVTVEPWRDDDAVVTSQAEVVVGPRIDMDLLRFLMNENARFDFGAFGLVSPALPEDPSTVVFRHALVGSGCDKRELWASVQSVLRVADMYDERIKARWGGHCAVERKRVRVNGGARQGSGDTDTFDGPDEG
jgi:hypothetical protein